MLVWMDGGSYAGVGMGWTGDGRLEYNCRAGTSAGLPLQPH